MSEIVGKEFGDADFALAIISTVFCGVCYLLIWERPEFSPTMSEEDKCRLR